MEVLVPSLKFLVVECFSGLEGFICGLVGLAVWVLSVGGLGVVGVVGLVYSGCCWFHEFLVWGVFWWVV